MHRKATVVQVDSLRRLGLYYWDGGASVPVPAPFLGGAGGTGAKQNPSFFGFAALPRAYDEILVGHMGQRPVASYSATTQTSRYPQIAPGESGQWDGDGKRTADVFHRDGSTTIFDFHGGASITVDASGTIVTITAPNGLNIIGNVNITGTLKVNGVAVTVP
ncbi:MAG: hypothetical protein JWO59_748 [Chloroflexi bacterium]|nr:hypothetical protein [Chloroflexota bacterium]